MTEMSPQEAAAVWTRVPDVEQQLTSRVVGLANILTGLAIATAGIPMGRVLGVGSWAHPLSLAVMLGLVFLFLAIRQGLWNVYRLAKPDGVDLLYRYRPRGSSRWLTVDWWYLAAFVWWFVGAWVGNSWPDPLHRSTSLLPLFLTVYTIAGGLWESKQKWSRRPYLLVIGITTCTLGWALHVLDAFDFGLLVFLGAGWVVSGWALYTQV